jgi:uncharacterized protein (DUF1499 family)
MNIVRDLLPWEPLFLVSTAGLVGTALTALVSLLRRRRVGPVRRLLLGMFTVGALLPWLAVRNFGERFAQGGSTNRADTATNTRSDLQPRQYAAPTQQVGDAIAVAFDQLGWELVYRNATSLEAEVPVARMGWFLDDFKVTLTEANGTTTVNAQSQSRVGRGDLGENRRHVVQLFTVLDPTLER